MTSAPDQNASGGPHLTSLAFPDLPVPPDHSAYPSEPLGRVPALDGIRALAVAAVLLFHGDIPGADGGFLGVSVFFTLSGFLITSLLLRQWAEHSAVGLRTFWSRRFRRLLPASWLTMALVLAIAAVGLWDTEQLRSLRGDVPWSLAELVNWHFIASGTTYGDSFTPPSPLEHFWSLAIEQQFYVVLPAIIVGLLVLGRQRSARRRLATLAGVLAGLTIASAVANGVLARGSIDRAYFGTDTRAAELLIGALLACATLQRLRIRTDTVRRLAVAAGALGLVVLIWLFHVAELASTWLYPWGLLLTACCTAALILGAIQSGPLDRLLAATPLPAIGKISYGVYLLHWPIFLVLTPARIGWSPWPLLGLRLVVTFVAAIVMFRLVETPIRTGHLGGTRAMRYAVPAAAVVLIVASQLVTRNLDPAPDFLQPRDAGEIVIRDVTTTTADPTTTAPTTTAAAGAPVTVPAPPAPPPTNPPVPPQRVLLVGDSIAASLEDALGDSLNARGISFASVAAPGCGVLTGDPADAQGQILSITTACNAAIPRIQSEGVETAGPDLVVALSSWEAGDRVVDGTWYGFGTPEADPVMRRLYREMFGRVTVGGAAVALVTVPDSVDGGIRRADAEAIRRTRLLNGFLIDLAATDPGRVTTLPLDQVVCPATPCPPQVDGITLRPRDGVHFDTADGASWAAERLADQIASIDLGQPL